MKELLAAVAAVLTVSAAGNAFAYCRAPTRAPEPPRAFDKPDHPDCMSDARYGEEPDCDQYELDRYQREVDRYVQKLQEYADDAQRYAREAQQYAQCEAAEIRETVN